MLDKRKKKFTSQISSSISLLFEKQKEYDWALLRIFHQRVDGYKETYNNYKLEEQSIS